MRRCSILAVLVVAVLSGGCSRLRNRELAAVAKDWSLVIRAAQVIPVYPLMEDLQPGDVFLVQTPISRQVDVWEKEGYLPLDMAETRLNVDACYPKVYAAAYWSADFASTPHQRGERPSAGEGVQVQPMKVEAPLAAFPSYDFEVRSGAGLKLAIPLSSVPVGLGLMKTNQANGSVQISEGFTYGLPIDKILPVLRAWADAPNIRAELRYMTQSSATPIYLRVVTRVYLSCGVTVSMRNTASGNLGVDAGAAQNIDLASLIVQDPKAADATLNAYKQALAAQKDVLNTITNNLPGGSVRVAYASGRSVTMTERFQRPIVVGYVGFDVKVDGNGELSAVIPTFDRLTKRYTTDPVSPTAGQLSEDQRAIQRYELEIKGLDASQRAIVVQYLLKELSPKQLPNAHEQAQGLKWDDTAAVDGLIDTVFRDLGQYSAGSSKKRNDVIVYLNRAIRQVVR